MLYQRSGIIFLDKKPIGECTAEEIYEDATRHLQVCHEEMHEEPPYENCANYRVYDEWLGRIAQEK